MGILRGGYRVSDDRCFELNTKQENDMEMPMRCLVYHVNLAVNSVNAETTMIMRIRNSHI